MEEYWVISGEACLLAQEVRRNFYINGKATLKITAIWR